MKEKRQNSNVIKNALIPQENISIGELAGVNKEDFSFVIEIESYCNGFLGINVVCCKDDEKKTIIEGYIHPKEAPKISFSLKELWFSDGKVDDVIKLKIAKTMAPNCYLEYKPKDSALVVLYKPPNEKIKNSSWYGMEICLYDNCSIPEFLGCTKNFYSRHSLHIY